MIPNSTAPTPPPPSTTSATSSAEAAEDATTAATIATTTAPVHMTLVAPTLPRLIEIIGSQKQGAGSMQGVVSGVSLVGLTFTHTSHTSLLPYEVTSPGDWSLHRGGTVFIEGAADVLVGDND
jgi:hypothetical protein